MGPADFPWTIVKFQARFVDEQSCLDYLFRCRRPEGFVCPRCGGREAWPVAARRLWQCAGCRYQASLTAGTVLHKMHTPLRVWFWAACLLQSTGTPGISAVQLQSQRGLSRYQTAWTMLHKLRRAMVDPERTPLTGEVEVDECEVGGVEQGRRSGRSLTAKAAEVIVAVEVRGQGSGRIRRRIIPDASGQSLCGFVHDTVAPGAIVHTDGWDGYRPLARAGYDHPPRSQRAAKRTGDTEPVMPRVHRAISKGHLQVYLDEFVFRYNRRRSPMSAFQSLLGLESRQQPMTCRQIVKQGPHARHRT